MRKTVFSLFLFLIFQQFSFGQAEHQGPVNWLSIEEAFELNKANPKPIIIDVYTSWCGYCKVMDKNTFSNPDIANYINQHFYAVKFDAETSDTITYQGQVYTNPQPGVRRSTHSLAVKLLERRLSYPTIIYFDKTGRKNLAPGYQTPQQIQPLLVYFAEEIYNGGMNFQDFNKNYSRTFLNDTTDTWTPSPYKTYTLQEALKLQKKKPKKILIEFTSSYSVSSRMMPTTWGDEQVAKQLNENYYLVRFDALSQEEIDAFGQKFINNTQEHPFHNLPVAMLEGKMKFPSFIILDKDLKMVLRLQNYLPVSRTEEVLRYYGEDLYLTMKWEDFISSKTK